MSDIKISQEQAKQFAYDCFDVIVQNIKNQKEEKRKNNQPPPTDSPGKVVNM